ncbi:MAG: RNA polymerase sigma factor [Bacteroidota bacterium]
MSRNEMTDEELMRQYQLNKNTKAFECIYDRHFISLSKYLFWLSGKTERSKDLAQNIFIKVFNNPYLFDNTKNFKVWLFVIAKNAWKNEIRNRSRRLILERNVTLQSSSIQESESEDVIQQRRKEVNSAIDYLSENHKEVILLKYSNNFTIEEIAKILNCSEGTVKSRLFYAIKNLKKYTGV